MITRQIGQKSNLAIAVVTGGLVTLFWFLTTWRYGFDLADEGFYWYGAQRVLLGEIPIRDFMAYDIGRYYWAASIMHLIGTDGIWSARLGAAIFQVIGIVVGVYLCLTVSTKEGLTRWIYAIFVACILIIWMFPYYKVYDHVISIILIASITTMLTYRTTRIWLFGGICLGLAATIGRNHGVYGGLAVLSIMVYLSIRDRSITNLFSLTLFYCLGVLIGFLPTLWMFVFVDGFFIAFVDSVCVLFETGTTNIGLEIPWPWHVYEGGLGFVTNAMELAIGSYFMLLIVLPIVFLILLRIKYGLSGMTVRYIIISAIALGIPYVHYSFSRADSIHLGLGILPVMIGLLTVVGNIKGNRSLVLGLLVLFSSILATIQSQAFLSFSLNNNSYIKNKVNGEDIYIRPAIAAKLDVVAGYKDANVNRKFSFLAIPDMPSIHAIHHEKIPIWEIYSLFNRSASFELKEIAKLNRKKPNFILLSDHALDGKLAYKYSNMHPLIYKWINENYIESESALSASVSNFSVYAIKH